MGSERASSLLGLWLLLWDPLLDPRALDSGFAKKLCLNSYFHLMVAAEMSPCGVQDVNRWEMDPQQPMTEERKDTRPVLGSCCCGIHLIILVYAETI